MALALRSAWILLLPVASLALADDPVVPNRPNFTSACTTTTKGRYVLQLGYRQTQSPDVLHDYGDGAALLYGVTPQLEVDLDLPSFLVQDGHGYGDSGIGFKWRMREARGSSRPAMAVTLNTTLPTADEGYGENGPQPEGRFLLSYFPSPTDEVDANILVGLPMDDGRRYTRFGISTSLTHGFTKSSAWFAELYALFPGSYRGPNRSYADIGVTHLLDNDCQIDAYVGHGLEGDSPDRFFGAGIAYRF